MIHVYSSKKQGVSSIIEQLVKDFEVSGHADIFIKPNLGGRYPIIPGENTSFDIMDELCGQLTKLGCRDIAIGHTSLLNFGKDKYDFETLIQQSGFSKLRKYPNVRLLNLDDAPRTAVTVKGVTFQIPEIACTHYYMNVCSLKTHMETAVSLSLKNQIGLQLERERIRNHQVDLDQHIALLGAAIKPRLSLIDGRIGMQGNGPHHGYPANAGILVAGDDMVGVDSLAASFMGISHEHVRHIMLAAQEGVGKIALNEAMLYYKKYGKKFKQASPYYQKYFFLRVWPNMACSGCIFSLSDAHKKICKDPGNLLAFIGKVVRPGKFDILLGKNAERNEARYSSCAYAIGNCTKGFAEKKKGIHFLSGCPPKKEDIIRFLLQRG